MRHGVEFVTTGDITERANVISFNVLSCLFFFFNSYGYSCWGSGLASVATGNGASKISQ